MRPAERLIPKLTDVKQTGPDRWLAQCPAHEDKRPSLSIRELDDGRVLINCFAGCGAANVLDAVGLEFQDLYPEHRGHRAPERRRVPAIDALRALAHEARVVGLAAEDIAGGKPLSESDRDRLFQAIGRISRGVDIAGG